MLNNAASNYHHLQVDNCPKSLFNEVKAVLEEKEGHISILHLKRKKIKVVRILGKIITLLVSISSLVYFSNFDLFSLIK